MVNGILAIRNFRDILSFPIPYVEVQSGIGCVSAIPLHVSGTGGVLQAPSSYQMHDDRRTEQNQEDDEQDSSKIHRNSGNAAESECSGNNSDNEDSVPSRGV